MLSPYIFILTKAIVMHFILIIIGIIVTLYLLDKLGLWLERKGLLYYRLQKPKGICSNVLQELNAMLSNSNRPMIEVKENQVKHKKSKARTPREPF